MPAGKNITLFQRAGFDSTVRDFDAFHIFRSGKTAKITHGGIERGSGGSGKRFGWRITASGGDGKQACRAGEEGVNCGKVWEMQKRGQNSLTPPLPFCILALVATRRGGVRPSPFPFAAKSATREKPK